MLFPRYIKLAFVLFLASAQAVVITPAAGATIIFNGSDPVSGNPITCPADICGQINLTQINANTVEANFTMQGPTTPGAYTIAVDLKTIAGLTNLSFANISDPNVTFSFNAAGFTDASRTYNVRGDFPNSLVLRTTLGESVTVRVSSTSAIDANTVFTDGLLHLGAIDPEGNSVKLDGDTYQTTTETPEGSTVALVGAGLALLASSRRRR